MAKNKIELKDFSIQEVENKTLYKLLNENATMILDTSICEVVGSKDEVEPILQIVKGEAENLVVITTFGYVGRFTFKKQEFNITYRFGSILLDRMITKVNSFDIKTLKYESKNSNKKQDDSLAMKILYLNFIFKLEKLSILGIPKSYQRVEHHDNRYRGQLDINRFIKKDIPYQGKISTISYEQLYVQEILDVLYGALVIVEKSMFELVSDRVFQIKNLVYNHANRRLVDERTIENAIYHKSIQNSLYADFKQVLEIASYIIRYNNKQEYKANNIFSGLIFDVSLLWENYLYKLLKENIEYENWQVIHEEKLEVYDGMFYKRNMYPDIVIKNDNSKQILVLDAKSKSMTFKGRNNFDAGDVDRDDFYQIHTYMTYYKNQDYKVLVGGLLYPIEGDFKEEYSHSKDWLGEQNTKFIVDGIDLSKVNLSMDDILESEKSFVARIKQISGVS